MAVTSFMDDPKVQYSHYVNLDLLKEQGSIDYNRGPFLPTKSVFLIKWKNMILLKEEGNVTLLKYFSIFC